MIQDRRLNVHGDNIIECERAVELIRDAFASDSAKLIGPHGSTVCPEYSIVCEQIELKLSLVLYPGFGRWDHDILDLLRQRGGILREAPDVIISEVIDDREYPLMAIEHCSALLAGNQAWQRHGRAHSLGKAHITYLYVAELGGYELTKLRERKAPRLPNPATPFAFLIFTLNNLTPVLPIFLTSPGADSESRRHYKSAFGRPELLVLMRSIILKENTSKPIADLTNKALAFIEKRAEASKTKKTMLPAQWKAAYKYAAIEHGLVRYSIDEIRLPWKKKKAQKVTITDEAKALLSLASDLGFGLTSGDMPMCVIPKANRQLFSERVGALFPDRLSNDFRKWLNRPEDLSVSWVMGFKPKGDDARPDRGLPALTRMLIGEGEDLLTVVYGPAGENTWASLENTPHDLKSDNGLWEAIFEASDALLVASPNDSIKRHGYLKDHWFKQIATQQTGLSVVTPRPKDFLENDVDTALHLLLSRNSGADVFEGLCNPPGGDWSGVSLQTKDRTRELRWLTLPRVTEEGSKRPDHVFQLFGVSSKPIILSIESKELATKVEENIGPRLNAYLEGLLKYEASIDREVGATSWNHSNHKFDLHHFDLASGAAFLKTTEKSLAAATERSRADIVLVLDFSPDALTCQIQLTANTKLGEIIEARLRATIMGQSGFKYI